MTQIISTFIAALVALGILFSGGCSEDANVDSTTEDSGGTDDTVDLTCLGNDTNIATDAPQWIQDNFKCVTIYMSGTDIIIETDSVPDHTSPYWGSGDANYEDMPVGGTQLIPSFVDQNYSFTIPETPTDQPSPVSMFAGAVAVSVDGVVMFKGQTSTSSSLSTEASTFDNGNAHPNGGEYIYHYHGEPAKQTDYETSLVGIMADGYPIYGPLEEDGSTPGTGAYPSLDAQTYGHTHATNDFPSGTFHYHLYQWDGAVAIGIMPLYFQGLASPSDVTNL